MSAPPTYAVTISTAEDGEAEVVATYAVTVSVNGDSDAVSPVTAVSRNVTIVSPLSPVGPTLIPAGYVPQQVVGPAGPAGAEANYSPLASRPSASAAGDKAIWDVTDEGHTPYISEAGAWVQMADPAGAAATAQSAAEAAAETFATAAVSTETSRAEDAEATLLPIATVPTGDVTGVNLASPLTVQGIRGHTLPAAISNVMPVKLASASELDLFAYGVVPDGLRINDAKITSGQAVLTSTSSAGLFASSAIGKFVLVTGAGVGGADLVTTVTGCSPGVSLTLAANASTTVTNKPAVWGTDFTSQLQQAEIDLFNAGGGYITCSQPGTGFLVLAGAVQTGYAIGVTAPSSGTWTLTINGHTTSALSATATAAQVLSALAGFGLAGLQVITTSVGWTIYTSASYIGGASITGAGATLTAATYSAQILLPPQIEGAALGELPATFTMPSGQTTSLTQPGRIVLGIRGIAQGLTAGFSGAQSSSGVSIVSFCQTAGSWVIDAIPAQAQPTGHPWMVTDICPAFDRADFYVPVNPQCGGVNAWACQSGFSLGLAIKSLDSSLTNSTTLTGTMPALACPQVDNNSVSWWRDVVLYRTPVGIIVNEHTVAQGHSKLHGTAIMVGGQEGAHSAWFDFGAEDCGSVVAPLTSVPWNTSPGFSQSSLGPVPIDGRVDVEQATGWNLIVSDATNVLQGRLAVFSTTSGINSGLTNVGGYLLDIVNLGRSAKTWKASYPYDGFSRNNDAAIGDTRWPAIGSCDQSGNTWYHNASGSLYNGTTSAPWQTIQFQGATYKASVTYVPGQGVTYGGHYYACYSPCTAVTPGTNAAAWYDLGTGGSQPFALCMPFNSSVPAYSSGAAYTVGQTVSYGSLNFICLIACTGQEPDTSPTYWQAFAGMGGSVVCGYYDVSGSLGGSRSLAAQIVIPLGAYDVGIEFGQKVTLPLNLATQASNQKYRARLVYTSATTANLLIDRVKSGVVTNHVTQSVNLNQSTASSPTVVTVQVQYSLGSSPATTDQIDVFLSNYGTSTPQASYTLGSNDTGPAQPSTPLRFDGLYAGTDDTGSLVESFQIVPKDCLTSVAGLVGDPTEAQVLTALGLSGGPFLPESGGTMTGAIVLASGPTASFNPVTLQYLENEQSLKPPCQWATNGALPSYIGTGTGTLAGTGFGALTIDGNAVAVNDRVLNTNTGPDAGIWFVDQVGSVSSSWVLLRAADMTTGAQVPGAIVTVEGGTANSGSVWVVSSGEGPYTAWTTSISWAKLSGVTLAAIEALLTAAGQLIVGTGSGTGELLAKGTTGQVLTVGGSDGSGLEWTRAGVLAVVQYAPITSTNPTTTSSSLSAIDTTNLTVSFTAPPSGAVLVRLVATVGTSTAADYISFNLFTHGSTTPVGYSRRVWGQTQTGESACEIYVSGLTAGSTYQYDWAWAVGSGATATMYYSNQSTGGTPGGSPPLMVVTAAV